MKYHKVFLTILIVSILFVVCGCKSSEKATYSAWDLFDKKEFDALFDIYNSYGGSVCMGISGPDSDRDNAVLVATERCLQYLAFYRGLAVQVDFGSVADSSDISGTSGVSDYNVIGGTSNRIHSSAAEDMEIVRVEWLGGKIGAAVFARLPEMKSIGSTQYSPFDKLPSIPGYVVAVATSESRYSSFNELIEAATFRAAQSLLDNSNSTVNVSNTIVETTGDHYRGDLYSISGNRLEGFTVLAYGYRIEDRKVYALAAAKNIKGE